jgi:hypothetical protein
MTDSFAWPEDESGFPTKEIEDWQFFTSASDDEGQSEVLMGRVEPRLARKVDEAIQLAKEKGVNIRTRSDFVRLAVSKTIDELVIYLNIEDEELKHFLLIQREAMKAAQVSYSRVQTVSTIKQLVDGLYLLTSDKHQEWEAARGDLNAFLKPVLAMAGDQDILMRTYIRELFTSRPFVRVLSRLEENKVSLGNVIENAISAYNNMKKR